MPNMSYCRFQNTNQDLSDCVDYLNEFGLNNQCEDKDKLSRAEFEAACELIEKCKEVFELFENKDLYEISKEIKF